MSLLESTPHVFWKMVPYLSNCMQSPFSRLSKLAQEIEIWFQSINETMAPWVCGARRAKARPALGLQQRLRMLFSGAEFSQVHVNFQGISIPVSADVMGFL